MGIPQYAIAYMSQAKKKRSMTFYIVDLFVQYIVLYIVQKGSCDDTFTCTVQQRVVPLIIVMGGGG